MRVCIILSIVRQTSHTDKYMPAEGSPRSVFRRDTPSIEPTVYAAQCTSAHVHWICSGNMKKRAMLWPAFHFHSVLLSFVNLWPISTLCVADTVHAVADIVCGRYGCGRYRRFPVKLCPPPSMGMNPQYFQRKCHNKIPRGPPLVGALNIQGGNAH